MALPSSMQATARETKTGIVLGVHVSTARNFNIELRRSTQSSTASTNWVTELLQPTSGFFTHVVPLPLSTRRFYFQARHTGLGYSPGPYTATVSALPVALPLAIVTPITRGASGDIEAPQANVWLTSAKTIKVGTQASTASIAKRIRLIACGFVPENSTMAYSHVTGKLEVAGTVARVFQAAVPIQPGVTLTRVRLHGKRGASTAGICQASLYRISTAGTLTSLGSAVRLSSGMGSTQSGTFTHLVSTANGYLIQLTLKNGTTASSNRAQLVWAEALYTMPTFDRTV